MRFFASLRMTNSCDFIRASLGNKKPPALEGGGLSCLTCQWVTVSAVTLRSLMGCTGLLLCFIIACILLICASDISTGVLSTIHFTLSLHGGVVREPLYL